MRAVSRRSCSHPSRFTPARFTPTTTGTATRTRPHPGPGSQLPGEHTATGPVSACTRRRDLGAHRGALSCTGTGERPARGRSGAGNTGAGNTAREITRDHGAGLTPGIPITPTAPPSRSIRRPAGRISRFDLHICTVVHVYTCVYAYRYSVWMHWSQSAHTCIHAHRYVHLLDISHRESRE